MKNEIKHTLNKHKLRVVDTPIRHFEEIRAKSFGPLAFLCRNQSSKKLWISLARGRPKIIIVIYGKYG